ncbi:hypothetical protein ACFWV1_12850 [Streptomyces sp. NPDC058700]|uniref:hypothetical protein n=1 Tax=Streptomyces sp. NPDC058700 TaxID=3346607 RepID=UPI00364A1FFD
MAPSAVPAAIDALLEILRAAPALADVQIVDGPPVDDQSVPDQLFVGWQPGEGESASLLQDFAYAGARQRDENGVINCWIDCWTGDIDIRPRRQRAFALLAVVEEALRASDAAREAPTLNGTVQWSQLAAGALRQSSTEQGARAGLGFTVSYFARI